MKESKEYRTTSDQTYWTENMYGLYAVWVFIGKRYYIKVYIGDHTKVDMIH